MNALQNGYNQMFYGYVLMIPFPATLTGNRKGTVMVLGILMILVFRLFYIEMKLKKVYQQKNIKL